MYLQVHDKVQIIFRLFWSTQREETARDVSLNWTLWRHNKIISVSILIVDVTIIVVVVVVVPYRKNTLIEYHFTLLIWWKWETKLCSPTECNNISGTFTSFHLCISFFYSSNSIENTHECVGRGTMCIHSSIKENNKKKRGENQLILIVYMYLCTMYLSRSI